MAFGNQNWIVNSSKNCLFYSDHANDNKKSAPKKNQIFIFEEEKTKFSFFLENSEHFSQFGPTKENTNQITTTTTTKFPNLIEEVNR